jgi:hypothetical protein
MIGLSYVKKIAPTILASHNALDFEIHSPSTDSYATLSYGTDADWTKVMPCDDADAVGKIPTSIHLNTQDTLIPKHFYNTRQEDNSNPVNNDHDFDLDDHPNQSNDLLDFTQPTGEAIFSGLPPLYKGRPDVHLRHGILNARQLAAAGEPDAEKAFFVADLGEVYKQHIRWTTCLPEIQPFYGMPLVLLSASSKLTLHQRLSATQILTSFDSSPLLEQVSTVHPTAKSTKYSQMVLSTLPVSFLPTHARPSPSSAPQPGPVSTL